MLARTRKAFTLLELIVVIVILGILAALAIPTFAAVIRKSKIATLKTSAASLGRDAAAYAAFENRGVTSADLTAVAGEIDVNGTATGSGVVVAGNVATLTSETGVSVKLTFATDAAKGDAGVVTEA